jgi:hypothetical protein
VSPLVRPSLCHPLSLLVCRTALTACHIAARPSNCPCLPHRCHRWPVPHAALSPLSLHQSSACDPQNGCGSPPSCARLSRCHGWLLTPPPASPFSRHRVRRERCKAAPPLLVRATSRRAVMSLPGLSSPSPSSPCRPARSRVQSHQTPKATVEL